MDKKHITESDEEFWSLTDEDREALRVGRVIMQQWEIREAIINRIEKLLEWVFNIEA